MFNLHLFFHHGHVRMIEDGTTAEDANNHGLVLGEPELNHYMAAEGNHD
jgi:hypothetical protein